MKLPSKKVSKDCNIFCKPGEFLDFSLEDNLVVCNKCPHGTYSLGGSKSISKWNDAILSEFVNNCYVIINDDIKTNERCDRFTVHRDTDGKTSLIAGGNKLNKDAMYSYELIYNVHMKKSGKITFTFRKETLVSNKYVNGQFNFYIDYDLKLQNAKDEGNNISSIF